VWRQQVNWEWLVLDDSPGPSPFMQTLAARNAWVHYFHSSQPMSVGAKRNYLVDAARGSSVAHFDDVDYYAPHYLASMIGVSEKPELVKLPGLCLYAPRAQFFGYMDLNGLTGLHYVLVGAEQTVGHIEFHDRMWIGADFALFDGFSCVYRRALIAVAHFDARDVCEDKSFIRPVVETNRKVIAVDDPAQSCLHLIHPQSTSRCSARHSMPPFVLPKLFPEYEGFPVKATDEADPAVAGPV
jgi:hypothetical protein